MILLDTNVVLYALRGQLEKPFRIGPSGTTGESLRVDWRLSKKTESLCALCGAIYPGSPGRETFRVAPWARTGIFFLPL